MTTPTPVGDQTHYNNAFAALSTLQSEMPLIQPAWIEKIANIQDHLTAAGNQLSDLLYATAPVQS